MHNRIAEALELLRVTPENLAAQVEEIFMSVEAGGETHRPDRLIDAQQEYECYILYFVCFCFFFFDYFYFIIK